MVVVRFKGGLGNQIFQYAAGRALAHRHNQRLFLDSSWYARSENQSVVRRSFDLAAFRIHGQPIAAADLNKFVPVEFGRLTRARAHLARSWHGYEYWRYDGLDWNTEFERLGPNVLLEGYFQHPRYFDEVQNFLRDELITRDQLPGAVGGEIERLQAQDSVCIQVRRTDFVQDTGTAAVHGSCSVEYFRAAWGVITSRLSNAVGYVFADDPAWAYQTFKSWSGVTVVGPEWNGPAFIYQFCLMQACRNFIIANSTWGWWAAWLGGNPKKLVIMPERWCVDPGMQQQSLGLRIPGWLLC